MVLALAFLSILPGVQAVEARSSRPAFCLALARVYQYPQYKPVKAHGSVTMELVDQPKIGKEFVLKLLGPPDLIRPPLDFDGVSGQENS